MKAKTIYTLAQAAHAIAVEKGFYDEPKTLPRLIALIISESGEIVEAVRKDRHFDAKNYDSGGPFVIQQFEDVVKDTVGDEIADTIIRLLDCLGYQLEKSEKYNFDFDRIESTITSFSKPSFFAFKENEDWEGLYLRCCQFILAIANIKPTFEASPGFFIQLAIPIRGLIELAEKMRIPSDLLDFHIQEKMKYNKTRPHKHGKKF